VYLLSCFDGNKSYIFKPSVIHLVRLLEGEAGVSKVSTYT
jgi:hypothetical protein